MDRLVYRKPAGRALQPKLIIETITINRYNRNKRKMAEIERYKTNRDGTVLGASSFHKAPGLVRQADNGYGAAEKIGLHSILENGAL
jgi:hypothetical protein